jgi:hypothetical protein
MEGMQHSTSRMHEIKPMYKLEVEPGMGPSEYKWDIFLARDENGQSLITRHEHDVALDRLFRFFGSWTLRIIPHFFLRDLAIATSAPEPKPLTNHYSPMLHNVVVALALSFSDNELLRERELREKFVIEAKSRLDSEVRRPALSGVQSLAMLSSFYSGQGEQSLGFMYFGNYRLGPVSFYTHLFTSNAPQAWRFVWDKPVS